MKRLGLLGVGGWGKRYLETVARRSDCRIAAFARGSARQDVSVAGATACANWRDLVSLAAAGGLDAVIVATPPEVRVEIAEALVAARVPAVLEKPVALARAEVERLIARYVREAPGLPVLVDYVHLFAPAYRALAKRVREAAARGLVPVRIDTVGGNRGPERGWSSLYDYGPHDLAMCLDLLGPTAPLALADARSTRASAEESDQEPSKAGEVFEASFRSGAVDVHIAVGNGFGEKQRRLTVTLPGPRTLVYDDVRPSPYTLLEDGAPVPVDATPPLDVLLGELIDLTDAWQRGAVEPAVAAAHLRLSLRVAESLDSIAAACATAPQDRPWRT
jgi:predicted dehydrogenase